MATPGEQNFPYTEGDDETYTVTLKRQSDGSPVDLSAATVQAEVRDNFASNGGALIATATCTVVDGANGVFTMELASADTKVMGGQNYKYDVQVVIGGKKRTYLRGELQGTLEVTDL